MPFGSPTAAVPWDSSCPCELISPLRHNHELKARLLLQMRRRRHRELYALSQGAPSCPYPHLDLQEVPLRKDPMQRATRFPLLPHRGCCSALMWLSPHGERSPVPSVTGKEQAFGVTLWVRQ